jgi:CubicO group peptidase (beta-lactamase class C family)
MAPSRDRQFALFSFVAFLLIATHAFAQPVRGDEAFTRSADAAVDRIAREDGFSGVILVARGDRVLLRKAAGLADRERNIPNTPETRFPIWSMTKQFTAAAIMLLVQDGSLSVSDPVSKHYPAAPPAWRDVTIQHLLTHSSGIGDFREADQPGFDSSEDTLRLAAARPTAFAPGTAHQYNSAGYVLLAVMIERVSGQRYIDFLNSRMFSPLGMRQTGFGEIPQSNLVGYRRTPEGQWQRGGTGYTAGVEGAGGVYSTVDDLRIWHRALTTDRILSAQSRRAMFTDYGHKYGYGWRLASKHGRQLIWHSGNYESAGTASILDYFPEEGLTVIVLTNNTGLTPFMATLVVGGQVITFPANAARKLIDEVEKLYYVGPSP